VVADVLQRPLIEDEEITARIRARFAGRGLQMPEINRRQAMVPAGGRVVPNANGTAPGLWIEHGDQLVLLLPGPPRELKPMMTALAEGRLRERAGGLSLVRRVIRITGRSESHTDEAVQPLYAEWSRAAVPISATILASLGQIELHLTDLLRYARRRGGGARSCGRAGKGSDGPARLQHRRARARGGTRRDACARATSPSRSPSRAQAD
jgi:nicotinamide-nucleotide amidase